LGGNEQEIFGGNFSFPFGGFSVLLVAGVKKSVDVSRVEEKRGVCRKV